MIEYSEKYMKYKQYIERKIKIKKISKNMLTLGDLYDILNTTKTEHHLPRDDEKVSR